jgi:hypothetical protein
MPYQICQRRQHYYDPAKDNLCPFCKSAGQLSGPALADETIQAFDPPLGWLVALDGPSCGQDFTLRFGDNRFGSDASNAVLCGGDAAADAVIAYDRDSNRFLLRPSPGRPPAYRNNKLLETSAELRIGDKITLGGTTLVFVPLAGDEFRWD